MGYLTNEGLSVSSSLSLLRQIDLLSSKKHTVLFHTYVLTSRLPFKVHCVACTCNLLREGDQFL